MIDLQKDKIGLQDCRIQNLQSGEKLLLQRVWRIKRVTLAARIPNHLLMVGEKSIKVFLCRISPKFSYGNISLTFDCFFVFTAPMRLLQLFFQVGKEARMRVLRLDRRHAAERNIHREKRIEHFVTFYYYCCKYIVGFRRYAFCADQICENKHKVDARPASPKFPSKITLSWECRKITPINLGPCKTRCP